MITVFFPQKSVYSSVFLWEIIVAFHPSDINGIGVFVRIYPCPSVKSVVNLPENLRTAQRN